MKKFKYILYAVLVISWLSYSCFSFIHHYFEQQEIMNNERDPVGSIGSVIGSIEGAENATIIMENVQSNVKIEGQKADGKETNYLTPIIQTIIAGLIVSFLGFVATKLYEAINRNRSQTYLN